MVEYEIENSFQCYNGDTISIGGLGYDKLKDCEQDIFISDALTHEFIHLLLENTFNLTVSKLFDFIGDSLLNTDILKRSTCLTNDCRLWCEAVKEDGIGYIYNEYMLDNIDLIQAYIITGGK